MRLGGLASLVSFELVALVLSWRGVRTTFDSIESIRLRTRDDVELEAFIDAETNDWLLAFS